MDAFAPVPALIGGLLIGLASAVLWLGNGRIAGISGPFGQLLPPAQSVVWRAVFLVSLVAGAFVAAILVPGLGVGGPAGEPAQLASPPEGWTFGAPLWIAIAGLLIGFGTKIGSGCTSGHGVCGMSRFSGRSIVATITFMAAGFVTVAVMNALPIEVLQ